MLTAFRSRLTRRILALPWEKKYFLANLVCPSTSALVAAARGRRAAPIPLPEFSHIFYHQASVELEYAENSLRTLLWNIPETDEVILYDKGGCLPPRFFEQLVGQRWRSWAVHREASPDMASYTYGMNHSIPMARAPVVCMWRSDYLYPKGLCDVYRRHIQEHDAVFPYSVYIGSSHVRSDFIRRHWDRVENYDDAFWRANSNATYSIYESEDPVHFAMRQDTWRRVGGLNHQLWGYGWQFAEFSARLRARVPARRIKWFDGFTPLHQNHASSLMVDGAGTSEQKTREFREGEDRFAEFLGGRAQLECYQYRWHRRLKPIPPEKRLP